MSDDNTRKITIDVRLLRSVTIVARWGLDGAEIVKVYDAVIGPIPSAEEIFDALDADDRLDDLDAALEAVLCRPGHEDEDGEGVPDEWSLP